MQNLNKMDKQNSNALFENKKLNIYITDLHYSLEIDSEMRKSCKYKKLVNLFTIGIVDDLVFKIFHFVTSSSHFPKHPLHYNNLLNHRT